MRTQSARHWAAVILTFSITLADAANPVARPDSYTTAQNVTLNVVTPGVLANDTDADAQTLTAVRTSNPTHGTLALNANGSFTYLPATNYNGSDAFTYRAFDGAKYSSLVTVSISVTPPQITIVTPPTAQVVCLGGTTTFSVAASGPELRYQWSFGTNTLSGKTNHILVLSNITSANAGTYSVVVSATGATSKTNSATLTVNTPVSATPLTGAMRAIGGIVLFKTTASGTGPVAYLWKKGNTVISGQTSSSLMLTNLQINDSGVYSVVVSGACGSVTRSATLTVDSCFPSVDVMLVLDRSGSMTGQPYSDARSAASNFVHNLHLGGTNLDQAGLVSYNSSSTLDRTLTNSMSSLEQGVASIPAAGGYTCISCALQSGQAELLTARHKTNALPVMVLLSDGLPTAGDTSSNALAAATLAKIAGTRIFTVGLGDVDHALMRGIASTTNDYFYATNSSQLAALFDAISTVICRPPTNIFGPSNTVVCSGANVTLRVDASGCDAFSYQWRKDGVLLAGRTNSALVLNSVTSANTGLYAVEVRSACRNQTNFATLTVQRPVEIFSDVTEQSAFRGGSAGFHVGALGDALRYEWFFKNQLVGTNSTLIVTNVTMNQTGLYCVVVRGACGSPITTCASLILENRAPLAANDTYTIDEDTVLIIGAPGVLNNDLDPDADPLVALLSIGDGPVHGTLTLNTNGSFIYRSALNFHGVDSFGYYAGDGEPAYSELATVTITVTPRNDAPIASDDAYIINEDTILTVSAPGVLANDSDVDGDALLAVLVSNPAHGTLTLQANGAFAYAPHTNYNGTDSFTYRATDGALTSDIATVTIQINPTNDRPSAVNDDGYVVLEDQVLDVPVPGVLWNDTDADGDPLTTVLVKGTSRGTLALSSNGSFIYRPESNYFGSDTFTYVANDRRTVSLAATVSVTVLPVNDAPSFTGSSDQKVNINAGAQTVLNWAKNISAGPANESSQSLSFTVLNDSNSLFYVQPAITANGTLTFTPAPNVFGLANVRVVLHDDGGTANGGVDTSDEVTFRIVVNGPPTVSIVSPTNETVFLDPAAFSIIADAADPDGTVTNVQLFANGSSITNVGTAPFYVVWSNVLGGDYTLSAVAADDCGLTATSAPVNIHVIANAIVATGPIVLNRQNGLYEQFVTVLNRTVDTWANGVRLWISQMDATNRIWNATGTNNGVPYIDKVQAVLPGSNITFVIQYYLPNPASVPSPSLVAVPLPFNTPIQLPHIMRIAAINGTRRDVLFSTQRGRIYFIQSSDDLIHWKTHPQPMYGTGEIIACPEMQTGAKQFYRVLMTP